MNELNESLAFQLGSIKRLGNLVNKRLGNTLHNMTAFVITSCLGAVRAKLACRPCKHARNSDELP